MPSAKTEASLCAYLRQSLFKIISLLEEEKHVKQSWKDSIVICKLSIRKDGFVRKFLEQKDLQDLWMSKMPDAHGKKTM